MEYFINLKRVEIVERPEKISIPNNVYLVVLLHTVKNGSQWIEHFWTADFHGDPKKDVNDNDVEVHAVYQYDLTLDKLDKYSVFGDDYLKRLE